MPLKFVKMHGAGNDFVIIDARKKPLRLKKPQVQAIAARRTGIGCDQVIIMEKSKKADVFMRIYNADGGEVDSCGNATRCVGWFIMKEKKKQKLSVETKAGILYCERAGKDRVRVDMGAPRLGWREIPLSEPRDTLHLGFSLGGMSDPVGVSMGNPHAVFIVSNVEQVPVRAIGPELEHYRLFPERANISFAQAVNDRNIRLRVWERGAGETLACGTAACATLVALNRRGLTGNKAAIELPGGKLDVVWDKKTNHVFMTGPVSLSFSGQLDL